MNHPAQQPILNPLQGQDRYTDVTDLCTGTFGRVVLAHDPESGDQVAIKLISLKERPDYKLKLLERELHNHASLVHSNIVRLKDTFVKGLEVGLVMEYASHGDLRTYVTQRGSGLPEAEARRFYRQLVTALAFCHKRHIIHRDVKPENLLLTGGGEKPVLKLCDFGWSLKEDVCPATSPVGTLGYTAPEVLDTAQCHGYNGQAADVWSSGLVLHWMLVGRLPFIPKLSNVSNWVYAFPQDTNVSEQCKVLMSRLLVVDPEQRITLDNIKEDPWFCAEPVTDDNAQTDPVHLGEAEAAVTKQRIDQVLLEVRRNIAQAYPSALPAYSQEGAPVAGPAGIPGPGSSQDQKSQTGKGVTVNLNVLAPTSAQIGAADAGPAGILVPGSNQVQPSQTGTAPMVPSLADPCGSPAGAAPREIPGQSSLLLTHTEAVKTVLPAGTLGGSTTSLDTPSEEHDVVGPPQKRRKKEHVGDGERSPKHTPK